MKLLVPLLMSYDRFCIAILVGKIFPPSAVMSAVGCRRIRLPAKLADRIQMIPKSKKKPMMANTSVDLGDSATSAYDRSAEEIDEL